MLGEHGRDPLSRSVAVWFVLAAVAISLLYLYHTVLVERRADDRYLPVAHLDLSEPAPPPGRIAQREVLRIAVAPVISPERSLERYRGFVNYLAERMGRAPAFLRRSTYGEVNELVRFGRCELALVCTYSFIVGRRDFGMRAVLVPQINGETHYRSYIIVPADSQARTLLDLRGLRFASADLMSTTGWLYPMVWLRRRDLDPEAFFRESLATGSHDRSVYAVAEGHVDGAAVDSLVYDHLVETDDTVAARTRVIQRSPAFGMPPLVVPANLDPALEERLVATLLAMSEEPEGRAILAGLGIDRFVRPAPDIYESVRALVAAWEKGS